MLDVARNTFQILACLLIGFALYIFLLCHCADLMVCWTVCV